MRRGDYLIYNDMLWFVWITHLDGSYQIKPVNQGETWVGNMQVRHKDCTPITREVANIMRGV